MIKPLKRIVITLAFLIFFLFIFILITLYSRLNKHSSVDLFPESTISFLVEKNYNIISLDIEKDFLYLHLKNNENQETLRIFNLKSGKLINNFDLKK